MFVTCTFKNKICYINSVYNDIVVIQAKTLTKSLKSINKSQQQLTLAMYHMALYCRLFYDHKDHSVRSVARYHANIEPFH